MLSHKYIYIMLTFLIQIRCKMLLREQYYTKYKVNWIQLDNEHNEQYIIYFKIWNTNKQKIYINIAILFLIFAT